MRWRYRIGQFVTRLRARPDAVDHAAARAVLSEAAYRLFCEMPLGDQLHGLCVLRILRRAGCVAPHLEQAALLHDVGKAAGRISLPYRVAIVLLRGAAGRLPAWLGSPDARSWRYPFYVQNHHAELGAARCERAGCVSQVVALVRHHEMGPSAAWDDPTLRRALLALQEADEQC